MELQQVRCSCLLLQQLMTLETPTWLNRFYRNPRGNGRASCLLVVDI